MNISKQNIEYPSLLCKQRVLERTAIAPLYMALKRRKVIHSDTDLNSPSKSVINENQSNLKEVAKDLEQKVGCTFKVPFQIVYLSISYLQGCTMVSRTILISSRHFRCVHTTLSYRLTQTFPCSWYHSRVPPYRHLRPYKYPLPIGSPPGRFRL